MWHRFLIFIGWRNEFDWSPPSLGPEVAHPYIQHPALKCCEHCGGGKLNPIHKEPYDARRAAEVRGQAYPISGRGGFTPPADGFIVRSHIGSHPITDTTCDDSKCWCHWGVTRVPRPSYIEREH